MSSFIELYNLAKVNAETAIADGSNVVICGDPATGKSRLVVELSSKINARKYYVNREFEVPTPEHDHSEIKKLVRTLTTQRWLVCMHSSQREDFEHFKEEHGLLHTVLIQMPPMPCPKELWGTSYPDHEYIRNTFYNASYWDSDEQSALGSFFD